MFQLNTPPLAPRFMNKCLYKRVIRKQKKISQSVVNMYSNLSFNVYMLNSVIDIGSYEDYNEECYEDPWSDVHSQVVDKLVREQKREFLKPRRGLRRKVQESMLGDVQSRDDNSICLKYLGENGMYHAKLLEDCLIFARLLLRSKTKLDYVVAWTTFYKFRFPERAAIVSMADSVYYISRILDAGTEWNKCLDKVNRGYKKFNPKRGINKMRKFVNDLATPHQDWEKNINVEDILDGYDSGDSDGPVYFRTNSRGEEVPAVDLPPLQSKHAIDLMDRIKKGEFDNVQSAEECFESMRSLLDNYSALKKSPVITKLYKCLMYALSLSIFDKIGVSFDNLKYSKVEEEAIKNKYYLGADMVHTLLDTSLFLCERGYQCMKTGSMDPIYHSGGKYEAWFHEAREICLLRKTYGTPGFEGDYHTFLKRVLDCIDQGDAMYKFATRDGGLEKNLIDKVLCEIKLIKAFLVTQKEACKSRSAPFSILVHGTSSVGKSMFVDMLFNVYADIFSLPKGPENVYTRNPANKYWDLFKSCMWGCKMDDIAFLKPSQGPPDPSLLEVISVINNVVSVPPQADLSDKGQTPILFKFVVGSTNTSHINAFNSFSCPLAIQRRFPYVVTIYPKREYRSPEGFLDSHNLPVLDNNEFPNLWRIKVKKVIMNHHNENQADLEFVDEFMNVIDFIQWFCKKAKQHEETQANAKLCSDAMNNISICKGCYKPGYACSCDRVESADFFEDYFSDFDSYMLSHYSLARTYANEVNMVVQWETQYGVMSWYEKLQFIIVYILHWICFRSWWPIRYTGRALRLHKLMYMIMFKTKLSHEIWAKIFRSIGIMAHNKIGQYKWLFTIIGAITVALIGYKSYRVLKPRKDGDNPPYMRGYHDGEEDEKYSNFEKQTNLHSAVQGLTESRPIPSGHEFKNVWHNKNYQVSSFDIPPKSIGAKGVNQKQFLESVMRNCIGISCIISKEECGQVRRYGKAFCVGGCLYVTNSHNIPLDNFILSIEQSRFHDGVTTNLDVQITSRQIYRKPGSDIAFIYLPQLPNKKDFRGYMTQPTYRGNFPCSLLSRGIGGQEIYRFVQPCGYREEYTAQTNTTDLEICGRVVREALTKVGDCGSVLVSFTTSGPIIMGIHFKGNDFGFVYCIMVTSEDVSKAEKNFDEPVISSGVVDLESEVQSYTLTASLPEGDPSRFIEVGTAEIYGTLNVPRAKCRSKVTPTVIRQELLQRGYEVKYGKPVMSGWQPQRNALLDMLSVPAKMEFDILKRASFGYLHDILDNLGEDLNLVEVLNQHIAINGMPGVCFIDPINKATSAGFPWRKSKMHLLEREHCDLHDYCYSVNSDVQNKIDHSLLNYKKGISNHPVYTGSFKDEPRSFKKIESCATRLFCGDSLSNTIIVRMYFLPIIRVIQRNKFLFEAAVGMACQSTEWDALYHHLTKFGTDRMIAGDFKAYDKKLEPMLIKEAFHVMIQIAKKAGFSLKQQKVMWGIANDTSTSFVDFFGTLYRLYGTNPSGNPLTVIVNCICNALYMRYAYIKLNPLQECTSFKDNVTLVTYGDDNIMGVSSNAPWFNHTSLSAELAKIGVTYTMAEKERASVPYIHIRECSFLKRTFVFSAMLGKYVAPLDHDSIEKMLTTTVESRTISAEEQTMEIVASALREYFWYGEEIFQEKLKMLKDVVRKCELGMYVKDHTFPSFEELVTSFWSLSRELEKASRL
jgi:hypothetical protein